ncbi:MAG: helix-turn-helix domain-containing protein [Actinomycetota bacterium]
MPSERVGPLTRERRRELTRTALIEAAAELFARSGFHATSLEEIAQAAGFTRGAIYKNFKSKEDILIAVVDWTIERQFVAYADALEDATETSSNQVSAAADVWTRLFRRDRVLTLLTLELRLHALRNPEFRPRLEEWERHQVDRAARFIEERMEVGGLSLSIPADDLAALALASVEGIAQVAVIRSDGDERANELMKVLFGLLSSLVKPSTAGSQSRGRAKRR